MSISLEKNPENLEQYVNLDTELGDQKDELEENVQNIWKKFEKTIGDSDEEVLEGNEEQ